MSESNEVKWRNVVKIWGYFHKIIKNISDSLNLSKYIALICQITSNQTNIIVGREFLTSLFYEDSPYIASPLFFKLYPLKNKETKNTDRSDANKQNTKSHQTLWEKDMEKS